MARTAQDEERRQEGNDLGVQSRLLIFTGGVLKSGEGTLSWKGPRCRMEYKTCRTLRSAWTGSLPPGYQLLVRGKPCPAREGSRRRDLARWAEQKGNRSLPRSTWTWRFPERDKDFSGSICGGGDGKSTSSVTCWMTIWQSLTQQIWDGGPQEVAPKSGSVFLENLNTIFGHHTTPLSVLFGSLFVFHQTL